MPLVSIHFNTIGQLHSEHKQFDSLLLSMSLTWLKQPNTDIVNPLLLLTELESVYI